MRGSLIATLIFSWIVAVPAYGEDSLQRLFTTKKERAELEQRRHHGVRDEVKSTLPTADNVKMKGYILRSDGKNVVWYNDKSTLHPQGDSADITIGKTEIEKRRVPVGLPEGVVYLKPGQSYSRDEGAVRESYLNKPMVESSNASTLKNPSENVDVRNETPIENM